MKNQKNESIPLEESVEIVMETPNSPNEDSNTTKYKSFHYMEDGGVDVSILSTIETHKKLKPGVYDIWSEETRNGIVAKIKINNSKETFNQEIAYAFQDKIGKIIDKFYTKEIKSKVNSLGYNHKLGILLHGKPGTGKTSMFKSYFERLIKTENAIVFNFIHLWQFRIMWEFIVSIRAIQNNPIIIFIDELDEGFKNYDIERDLKVSMDGFSSIDNSLFMFSTNYINKIPDSIKNRKSRVKYCIEVGGIKDVEVIKKFLDGCFKTVEVDHDYSNDLTKLTGLTIDELKQYVLDIIMDVEVEINKQRMGYAT